MQDNVNSRQEALEKIYLMKKVRFVFGASLFLFGALFKLFGIYGFRATPFFVVASCLLFLNQPYTFITKRIQRLGWLKAIQQIGDVTLITLALYYLGGTDANFMIAIYALVIIFAGVIISSGSAFFVATLCCVAYMALSVLQLFGVVTKAPIFNFNLTSVLNMLILFFVCISFYLVAAISSFLANIIIRKAEETKQALHKLKETEDIMVQAEKLAVVGQFATGVVHEVKNPLGVAMSGVEFLEHELTQQPEASHALQKIKQSLLHANEIIRDLLTFARPEAQQLTVVNLNNVVEDCAGLLKDVARRSNLQNARIELRLAKRPIGVKIHKNQFKQVVFNVMINAGDAMPNGGTVTIRTFTQEHKEHGLKAGFRSSEAFVSREKVAVLEIQDDGIGISKENVRKIFDPFYTTKKQANTGLGLSISRRIIEAHKGEIEIKSQENIGTIVVIRLPLFSLPSAPEGE